MSENLGLYIHIPFCIKKCNYCDFNSYTGISDLHEGYFRAIFKEMRGIDFNYNIDTIYIGGGTPTCVKNEYITRLMHEIKYHNIIDKNAEISIECNPGTVSYEDLKKLKNSGINRISIGLQSTFDKHLKKLGRIHDFNDFDYCFKSARNAGFDNISVDLMFGLPDQTLDEWRESLLGLISYAPEHISCYSLKIEENTPFFNMDLSLPNDDENRNMYDLCIELLGQNGYNRYEISNFSKLGKESRHNLKYWRCDDYIGIGAGAFSCFKEKRFSNCFEVKEYINRIAKDDNAVESVEDLTVKDKMSEFIFLGLRTTRGISEKEFEHRFKMSVYKEYGNILDKYFSLGVMSKKDDRIFISSKMLYVSNSILAYFV